MSEKDARERPLEEILDDRDYSRVLKFIKEYPSLAFRLAGQRMRSSSLVGEVW
ncbi:MAG: hypothetical protein M3358_15785 [Actinomycetota bacterium]|nr:hypothetical protein [Actinomycetota bacterium]